MLWSTHQSHLKRGNEIIIMSTLGEKGLELIRESIRAQDMLGAFNEENVRAVLEEIKSLFEEVRRPKC